MSRANDLRLIAEKYSQVLEGTLDPRVQQFIDQMQVPGWSGANFAQLFQANDPYNVQAVQAMQSVIDKGITAQQYKNVLLQVLQPEIQAAQQQNLNAQQIAQRLMGSPHIMAQYFTTAAQKVLGGVNTPKPTLPGTPTAPTAPQQRVGGGLRTA